MTERRNEFEQDTWTPLAAANTKLLNKTFGTPFGSAAPTAPPSGPNEKQEVERHEKGRGGAQLKDDGVKDSEYLAYRLRELAAFERRARGRGR